MLWRSEIERQNTAEESDGFAWKKKSGKQFDHKRENSARLQINRLYQMYFWSIEESYLLFSSFYSIEKKEI